MFTTAQVLTFARNFYFDCAVAMIISIVALWRGFTGWMDAETYAQSNWSIQVFWLGAFGVVATIIVFVVDLNN